MPNYKNPTRPDASPIRVEHTQWDPAAYHQPHPQKRKPSPIKPFGRDEYGQTNITSADHPVIDDSDLIEAINKDLRSRNIVSKASTNNE